MGDNTIMTHVVKKEKSSEFENWLQGIVDAAAKFNGYKGINVLGPTNDRNGYTTTVRFNEQRDREVRGYSTIPNKHTYQFLINI